MSYLLDVLHDGQRHDQFVLAPGEELVFGRGGRSSVRLPDHHLSDPHLRAKVDTEGRLSIRDLGSKNGSELNGEAITHASVAAGDVFRMGDCTVIVRVAREDPSERRGSRRTELAISDSSCRSLFTSGDGLSSTPLASMITLAEALVGETPREALLEATGVAIEAELEFDRCIILTREGDWDEFRPAATFGVPSGEPAAMSRTVLREITEQPKALLIDDPGASTESDSDSIRELAITSYMCCPMIVRGDVLGVIYADRLESTSPFEESNLHYLRGVAHLLGLALHDHKLRHALEADNKRLRGALERRQGLIARSPIMLEVLRRAERMAEADAPVLIAGETGTGKELIARMVHDWSERSEGPFVPFNCALSNEALIESELFGHVDGAFTGAARNRKGRFQLASGGTLFLDEIGDMPLDTQAKLLRVLQEKQVWPVGSDSPVDVDVRIVSATNRNLTKRRRAGEFREDLYYRISMFSIDLPRLAKRGDDVIGIAESFLPEGIELSDDAREALLAYGWPGNVRELESVMLRSCFACRESVITLRDLPAAIAREGRRGVLETPVRTLREMEATHIAETLRRLQNNKKRTAEALGISRDTLYQKLRHYGIEA